MGPDLDVLLFVLSGAGQITTELDTLDLHAGALVWLPRRSQRRFTAGPEGLRYLTVHQRRQSLVLGAFGGKGKSSAAIITRPGQLMAYRRLTCACYSERLKLTRRLMARFSSVVLGTAGRASP